MLSSLRKVFSGLGVRRCGADARFDESINSTSSPPSPHPASTKLQICESSHSASFCLFGEEPSEEFVVVATET